MGESNKSKRRQLTPNDKLILYAEVDGVCPLCPNQLMYAKEKSNQVGFEIAHIYPLNPTEAEAELLNNEERLSSDPDNLDNLICLCTDCHPKFDKPRTVEEYRELVEKKKKIIAREKDVGLWKNSSLDNEIEEVIHLLLDDEYDPNTSDILSYDPKAIDDKVDNTLAPLTRRGIHLNVRDYYTRISNKFSELDKLTPLTTETISTQIRSHYLRLKKLDTSRSQQEIFDGIVDWLDKRTNRISKNACEIVASYFVQNCEIFE